MSPRPLPGGFFAAATLSSRMPACSVIIRNPGSDLLEGRTMLELRRSSIVTRVETAATHVLHRDYETRSRLDLRKVGAFLYAADVSTQVLCAAYAVDDDPVQLWWPGDPIPLEFKEAATDPAWIACAHLSNNSNSSVLSGLA